jgi:hypothetical protein
MNEQLEERRYSVFWPILIFLVAFAISSFYQLSQLVHQHEVLQQRYTAEAASLPKAQEAQNRLVSLINDLVSTGAKDPNAALVVQEAKQAGILHEKPPAARSSSTP